jgi:IS5 family transposase
LQESLAVATRTGAMKPSDLNRVIVDTTVQPKNITFPTEAKLVNRAREKLVNLADRLGVKLRQWLGLWYGGGRQARFQRVADRPL